MVEVRQRVHIRGVPLDTGRFEDITKSLISRAVDHIPTYVCVANVHMFMEALSNTKLLSAMDKSFHIVPDGMPLTWLLSKFATNGQERITGPDLMNVLCGLAEEHEISIALIGSTPDTLNILSKNLLTKFPRLKINFAFSPPFRKQTEDEEESVIHKCRTSGAQILFVGLGCPKQELWMARNYRNFPGPMLGVGAAFDYHAGLLSRAPAFMQRFALEWLWRLVQEPRRLFKRYLRTNIGFIFKILVPSFFSQSH